MAVRVSRSCDFRPIKGRARAEHNADLVAEVRVDGVSFTMDLCNEDMPALLETLQAIGFHPSKAQVGHNRRGAYLGKSGQPFTTKQAREWLQAQGVEVSEAGRLSAEQLQMYAQTH